ncbi:MAG TPA: beta-ketoacyl-ACP synthase [Roseococcus sp.]|nr:beta-ketoacyl-ACP synthase [Roseococcus sp.]
MKPVFITGVGLVSSHGEGRGVHAPLLAGGAAPMLARAKDAPYDIHPTPELPLDRFIPRREMRQMEPWQRIGVHAAGIAIEEAGLKPQVARMDVTVAAGGGERDAALDAAILAARPDSPGVHKMLLEGLRPTLFLAQLPNLLAGSISITHGVAGSSRTLMGEEVAGAEAARVAARRVAAGTSPLALTGAAMTSDRPELLLLYGLGGHLHDGPWAPLPGRQGMVLGSVAAFLTLEPEGANPAPLARLTAIETSQGRPEGRVARLGALLDRVGAEADMIISTASGAAAATADELAALPRAPDLFTADLFGHSAEAAFPAGLAMAAWAVAEGKARRVLVTGCGQWRGEAAAILEAV